MKTNSTIILFLVFAWGVYARTGSGQPSTNAALIVRSDGANDALTINTPILANGTNALVKAGAGSLVLGAGAVNTHTGGTFINQGTLQVAADSNFGDTTNINPITLNGGTLIGIPATAAVTLYANHPIFIGPAGGTINGTSNAFVSFMALW